jgi:dolichyl-diphosphooligosaccharide--protein glycosyltransferase
MEEENNEEEISIDLGKITSFFRRKKKEEAEEVKEEVKKLEEKKEELPKEDQIKIKEIKAEVKEEVKEAEKIDKEEEKFEKEIRETKEKIEEIKEEVEDDEIAIDLSKITKFFKKEKKESAEPKKQEPEGSDEEISFDLKSIKGLFKRKEKESIQDAEEDAISIDWKKAFDFIKKHQVVVLLLIPILFSIFLRVQPAYLPITDDWAHDAVMNNLRSQIRSQIDNLYPNLPAANKDALVEKELSKLLREQKNQIQKQIEGTSAYFKSRLQDDNKQTYLLAIDPWFWMRHARNILEHGHPGDEIKDGMPWDNHMYAPNGRGVPPDMFHAYFEAYLYIFFSFFSRDLELMKVVFYVPVLLSALSVIPAFFIARRLGGNFGGFVGAFIVAIHPAFLNRTAGGFADTDAYNILFPLMIAWLFLEALESNSLKKSIVLSSLSGILVGFFAFAWGGWWFIFDFIIGSTAIYLLYYLIIHRKELKQNITNALGKHEIKNTLITLLSFVVLSAIFVTFFRSFRSFINGVLRDPFGFAKLKEVGITTVWPNVFTTVAEQNPASLNSVIDQIGMGKWLFLLIALVGIVLTLTTLKEKKPWFVLGTVAWYIIIFVMNPQNLNLFLLLISIPIIIKLIIAVKEADTEIDVKYSIILIIWLISTIYASVKGVRFMLLLVPPFAIGFGIALGQLYTHISNWVANGLHINKYISKITVVILLSLLLVSPYQSARTTAEREIPSMNDAWYNSLTKIKEESAPNAIINSWWDFGHWFKYVGDRAVTFDGTSQNTPQAHWIGNTLLTSDEDTAVGILRMLDCSGYPRGAYAYDSVYSVVKDEPKSIDILYEIIPKDKAKAREILSKHNFKEEKIAEILNYTHCEPPEDYFITSEDMVGKSGVWAHFGSWNFDRALIYKTLKSKNYKNNLEQSTDFLQKRFNYSKSKSENLFYEIQSITNSRQANNWIAPWPSYAGVVGCGKIDNETLKCSDFIVNLTAYDVYIPTQQGNKYPKRASFQTNEGLILREYNDSIINLQNGRGLGVALAKKDDAYRLVQMDEALTASMFTRLFYMEGVGLRHFKKFSDERGITGGRIIVWKVDWEGKEKNIIKTKETATAEESEKTQAEEKEMPANLTQNKTNAS